jgi:predicted phosphodiesterase
MCDMAVSVGDIVQLSDLRLVHGRFQTLCLNILGKEKPFFVAFGNHDEPYNSLYTKHSKTAECTAFHSTTATRILPALIIQIASKAQCHPMDILIHCRWNGSNKTSPPKTPERNLEIFIHSRSAILRRWFDGSLLMQTYLVPLMEQYNVQICFSGHTHEYERGMLNGTF